MDFFSVRELRSNSKALWAALSSGSEIVITNNGKPSALMIDIPDGAFDETVQTVRQAKAILAMNGMRQKAARAGFLSDDEIDEIISDVRMDADI